MAADRSRFVAWCKEQFEGVADLRGFFALVDRIREHRQALRDEKSIEADNEIATCVQGVYARLREAEEKRGQTDE